MGGVAPATLRPSDECRMCHGDYDVPAEPYGTWAGSLMANAGRDPLFYAQMTTANQDVANAGTFCMRCHVPLAWVSGHAGVPDGSALDARDRQGIDCHFCHAMVDPIYRAGVSPPEDQGVLAGLQRVPQHYGNSMFVLDPSGLRRGPYADAAAPHPTTFAPFQSSSNMCGTCHEVGNVAVSKRPDGTYRYNPIGQPTPSENPEHQFPLERTFTEWRLSAFAGGGVDMGGRFGEAKGPVVSSCQDCHMPAVADGLACFYGPPRTKMPKHEFAGAAAQVLDLIAYAYRDDPDVDLAAISRSRSKAVDMLQRAATLDLTQSGSTLNVRVINETGHKLPTGHIEGRRVWINVRFTDAAGNVLKEYGRYDDQHAELEEWSTRVYEMHVGLSQDAATLTGLRAGPSARMSLADTIYKDNRIPPRGFNNAAFAAAGAPVVEHEYADGQYWDDAPFRIPANAHRANVMLYYQNTPRHYIETLRDNNHTNTWGQELYDAWNATGKGAPIAMAFTYLHLQPTCPGDLDDDGGVDTDDLLLFLERFEAGVLGADLDDGLGAGIPDGAVDISDLLYFVARFEGGC